MCGRESYNEENWKLVRNRKKWGLEIWNSRGSEREMLRIEQKYNLKNLKNWESTKSNIVNQ